MNLESQRLLDRFWGCTVETYELDLAAHTFRLTVGCPEGSVPFRARLVADGIAWWRFANEPGFLRSEILEEPWDYIELTSIEVGPIVIGDRAGWSVIAELWNSVLEFQCLNLAVQDLSPKG